MVPELLTQIVPKPCRCGSCYMWKWVRTVIPWNWNLELPNMSLSVTQRAQKTLRHEDGEERRRRDRHREEQRKQQHRGKRRRICEERRRRKRRSEEKEPQNEEERGQCVKDLRVKNKAIRR